MEIAHVLTAAGGAAIINHVSCVKTRKNLILKVEVRKAVLVQGVQTSHANSRRICVY